MRSTTRLRQMLQNPGLIVAPTDAVAVAGEEEALKQTGSIESLSEKQYGWQNLTTLLGLPEVDELEKKYGAS